MLNYVVLWPLERTVFCLINQSLDVVETCCCPDRHKRAALLASKSQLARACQSLHLLLQAALSGSGRYQKYARQFITATTPSEQCGEFEQLTSQFPGAGPCYAVWAQTYPWFYRSVCS